MKQERVRLLRALARELDRGAQRKILERACRRMGELVQSGKMKKPDAVDLALEVALNHQLWTSEDERADLEREIGEWIEAGIPKAPPRTQQKNKFCWREHSMSAQELCDQRFIEVKFLVPGLVPEGVTLLVSRPKMGKSWLLLQIGSGVAAGMSTLAIGDDPPTCGDVLYLSLEDGERRIQRRMTKYFGASRNNWPERLTIASAWRRLDQGALDDLREWCRSVNRPTLIMIDTLKRVRPPKRGGQSDYDADYETFEGLIKLTHELDRKSVV